MRSGPNLATLNMGGLNAALGVAHGYVLINGLAVVIRGLGSDGFAVAGTARIDLADDVAVVIPGDHAFSFLASVGLSWFEVGQNVQMAAYMFYRMGEQNG